MSRVSVEISGNLLSETILDSLAEETSKHSFAKPESFKWYKYDIIDSQSLHLSRIAEAYEQSKVRWDMLSSSFSELNISALRDKWIRYLLAQFGYNLEYQKADVVADSGNNFCLSHRGWVGQAAPIVHTVLFSQDLDHKPDDGRHKYSPHDTLQRYLNQVGADLWGIVTNGRELRILRDFHHETRQAYAKFDLELIFEGRNYNDFRLLWRLIHPSRFVAGEDGKCILENLFEESKDAGVAIGENLQKNVRLAIESLANGFLLSTPELIDKIIDNNEKSLYFYQQILRVIYRFLFLFYAEQRKLMPTHSALYARDYSLSSLRQKIELREFVDPQHTDLWEGLKVTFQMVYQGVPELGIPAFNGQLFKPQTIEQLNKSRCRNDQLLEAIQYMSVFEKEGLMHRISYIELSVDEIGAIYESLLEYIPRVSSKEEVFQDTVLGTRRNRERCIPPRTFFLDPRGTSRKTSGSYYTNPGLVNALIESALVPVLEEKLKTTGPNKDAQEKALLSIKVCDPACGSAAFLIAATECLGEQLAKIRIQSDYPSDADIRHARRQVLRHCIYGVDLNSMAVELAKVSLWLTAATSDQPLNFLDHRIKCGNSLIGATPELIKKGIPPETYSAVEGDDKEISKQRKKLTREYYRGKEREKGQLIMENMPVQYGFQRIGTADLSEMFDESSTKEVREIERTYRKNRGREEFLKNRFIADYWCSAFFWRHNSDNEDYPRPEGLEYLLGNEKVKITESLREKVDQIAKDYKFFHWYLEFPEVFAVGGFDCVLGNPPWEKLTIYQREFFAGKDDKIATTQKKSERKKLIGELEILNHELHELWVGELSKFQKTSIWLKNSQHFRLSNVGELNTYPLFTELSVNILNDNGRIGIIIKSALAISTTYKALFSDLLKNNRLVSFYDFKNWKFLFRSVGFHERFALLTLTGKNKPVEKHLFAFECLDVGDLNREKIHTLDLGMIKKFNPNTGVCPIFVNKEDIHIAQKIYSKFGVLVDENKRLNNWGIDYITQIHMSEGSHLFTSKEELNEKGYNQNGNVFERDGDICVPLYEGKYIQNYDYRFSSFENVPPSKRFSKKPATHTPTLEQRQNSSYEIEPRYWISKKAYLGLKQKHNIEYQFQFCCRLITNVISNARTCIGCVMPTYPTNNLCLILNFESKDVLEYSKKLVLFNSIFSSFVFDYISRQKVMANLLESVLWQLPLPSPSFLDNKKIGSIPLKDHIIDKAIKLIACSSKTKDIASILGYEDAPYVWDEPTREILRTEIDAIIAHTYSISYNELDYILDTFPIIKRKDMEKYGEYRTKRLILEKYEELKPMFK